MWDGVLFYSSSLACVFRLLTFADLGGYDIYDAILYRVSLYTIQDGIINIVAS